MKAKLLRPALIALIAFLLGCVVDEGFQLETRLGLDALFHLRGARTPPDDVVIVTIDEASDKEYDIGTNFTLWRGKHARLIKALHDQGAALILFDFYFSDAQADVDPQLAKAMQEAGNVLAVDCVQTERNGWGMCGHRPEPTKPIEIYPPTTQLAASLLDHAPFFLGDDAGDYVVRQSWMFLGNTPTLPVVTWLHTQNTNASLPNVSQQSRRLSESVSEQRKLCLPPDNHKIQAIPRELSLEQRIAEVICGSETRFIDYYGPPKTVKMVSYSDVREGRVNGFKGKTVFVGQVPRKTLPGVDSFVTPFTDTNSGKMAGVEVMATQYANLLEGRRIAPPVPFGLVMAIFGLIVSVLLTQFVGLNGIVASVLMSGAYCSLAVWCFSKNGYWLPIAVPLLLQLPISCFLSLYGSRLDQLAEAKVLKAKIAQVTAENNRLINQFIEQLNPVNPLNLSLSGEALSEKVAGVCLVSDIEHFTELAEKMPADVLLGRLRGYFKILGAIISSHGGKIANIAGDGMVAIWVDPTVAGQQRSACLATIQMSQAVDQFNTFTENQQLLTRFGLHEGDFAVGKIAGDRLDNNPIGDAINTASRIEGVNKLLGTRILASSAILAKESSLMFRPVGAFLLVGKNQPIELIEIMGIQSECNKTSQAVCKHFTKGLKAFRKGRWQQAQSILKKVQDNVGYDGPTQYYLEKISHEEKPPPDWQGYIKLETK
jgi:adenylate cyclase